MPLKIRFDKILPYSKYLILIWFSTVGFPYIYYDFCQKSVNRIGIALCYCAISIAFTVIMSKNKYIVRRKWGKSIISLLTVQMFFLLLFSQKHIIATGVILIFLGAASIVFYYMVLTATPNSRITAKTRRACRKSSAALVCYVAAAVLFVPSVIGFVDEYAHPLTENDVNALAEYFNADGENVSGKPDQILLEEIDKWHELDSEEKIELLSRIAVFEADYLGMGDYFTGNVKITAQKMEDYVNGDYNDATKTIRINIKFMSTNSARDVIFTLIHETFHSYENYLIASLDFNSPLVKSSYYFKNARLWKDNNENYIPGILYPEEYEAQPLEADANTFASERISVYIVQ